MRQILMFSNNIKSDRRSGRAFQTGQTEGVRHHGPKSFTELQLGRARADPKEPLVATCGQALRHGHNCATEVFVDAIGN